MVELVMPHKKYKKYIKLILGLIFILVLTEPLAELVTGKELLTANILESQIELEQKSLENQLEYYNSKQQDVIKGQYKDLLMQQIGHLLNKNGYVVVKGDVVTETVDESQLGGVKSIEVWVDEKTEEEESVTSIEKVVIEDIKIGDEEKVIVQKSNKHIIMENEVKEILSSFYHIGKDKVEVYALIES